MITLVSDLLIKLTQIKILVNIKEIIDLNELLWLGDQYLIKTSSKFYIGIKKTCWIVFSNFEFSIFFTKNDPVSKNNV